MPVQRQRKVAKELAPLVAGLFKVGPSDISAVNIRFHSYPPHNFAVGGRLLSDLVPLIGRIAKKIFG